MLIHDLVTRAAAAGPDRPALGDRHDALDYATLADAVARFASALVAHGLKPTERVAVYMPKTTRNVTAMLGAAAAGGVFVPVNPVLKARQVAHILADCDVRVLVTTDDRLALLGDAIGGCASLRTVVTTGTPGAPPGEGIAVHAFDDFANDGARAAQTGHRRIDTDMAAILYTSGSTGRPKGVVLSHRNLVAGAISVAEYLENTEHDRILSVLSLSFDAGLSQLTTAFSKGASVHLLEYLLPRDVIRAVAAQRISGLAAVPPLWIQLAALPWPREAVESLRYITNTGGAMPTAVTTRLREALPATRVYLMYGLTEAFRSTFLPPQELDRRPDSIGKAVPNAEILVVREDGSLCEAGEPGELVHRGALVAQGYWNDPERTAERFKPAPGQPAGIPTPELAVWSGDTVRRDEAGFLYFVGRRDEMIKTSGYRVSPTEIEEVVYASGLVGEAAALGVPDERLGQAIVLVVTPGEGGAVDTDAVLGACRDALPNFMVPSSVRVLDGLPRNPNGKIDRKSLALEHAAAPSPA